MMKEIDGDSEDDCECEMEDTDHELDREANDKDSDAVPTGFRLVDVELLTMAISHTRCKECKDGKLSLTEDETQRAGLMTSFYIPELEIVSCPAPSNAKSEKGSGQTCIGPVSQRNVQ